jgi:hypothetical protein
MFEHSSTNSATCATRNNRFNKHYPTALLKQREVNCASGIDRANASCVVRASCGSDIDALNVYRSPKRRTRFPKVMS